MDLGSGRAGAADDAKQRQRAGGMARGAFVAIVIAEEVVGEGGEGLAVAGAVAAPAARRGAEPSADATHKWSGEGIERDLGEREEEGGEKGAGSIG